LGRRKRQGSVSLPFITSSLRRLPTIHPREGNRSKIEQKKKKSVGGEDGAEFHPAPVQINMRKDLKCVVVGDGIHFFTTISYELNIVFSGGGQNVFA